MYRDYTLFEIICYSFFSLFLVIGATIDKLYFILPDEGAIALTIIGNNVFLIASLNSMQFSTPVYMF